MRTTKVIVIGLVLATVTMSAGQSSTPVSAADLTQLETSAADVDRLVVKLRPSDATLATEIDKALVDVREELSYLKVKLRREGRVTREEFVALRDRIEKLRIRAQGQKVSAQPVVDDDPGRAVTVPVGTQFEVRMQEPLSSATAKVEQRFEATTLVDVEVDGRLAIPAGSIVRGFVSSVKPAGNVDRRGSLTLSFDEIRIGNRSSRLRASVVQALDPKMTEDVSRIGAGAVVGGIVGGLIGGAKGALLGVLVGGGGTIAATEGSDVKLPLGTVLRIRVDQPLEVFAR
jgi:hypothetical protein